MELKLNAEEIAVLMMLHWPASFPGGKGIGGIIPYGIKNVLKWKNAIGLRNAVKRFEKKMTSLKLWNLPELGSIAMPILFFDKAVTIQRGKVLCKSIYWGEGLLVMMTYLGNDEYIFSVEDSLDEMDFDDLKGDDLNVILWGRDSKGKEIKVKEIKSCSERDIVEGFIYWWM